MSQIIALNCISSMIYSKFFTLSSAKKIIKSKHLCQLFCLFTNIILAKAEDKIEVFELISLAVTYLAIAQNIMPAFIISTSYILKCAKDNKLLKSKSNNFFYLIYKFILISIISDLSFFNISQELCTKYTKNIKNIISERNLKIISNMCLYFLVKNIKILSKAIEKLAVEIEKKTKKGKLLYRPLKVFSALLNFFKEFFS